MINLELPDLPYSKDALMPYMSAETLELHHDKHHMAYITNGNKFIKEQNIATDNVNDIVINSYQKNAPVFNNVAQHINHVHFWEVMKNNPDGKIPSGIAGRFHRAPWPVWPDGFQLPSWRLYCVFPYLLGV